MEKAILVLGGTGNVGAPLVAELVRRGERVKIASRTPSKVNVEGTEAVYVDLLRPETLAPALENVDRVYGVSPAGYANQPALLGPVIDAAAERGVKVVLQTAVGVDASDHIPLRRAELMLEKSGASFVILRPNWFADNFGNYWFNDVKNGEIRVPAADGKTSFIDARDIAAAAAVALTTNRFDGRAYNLTGPEALSYAQAADLLSAASGRRIGYASVDDESFVAARLASGYSEEYARLLAAIFHPVREGRAAAVTSSVVELTGATPRPLSAYVAENAAKFAA